MQKRAEKMQNWGETKVEPGGKNQESGNVEMDRKMWNRAEKWGIGEKRNEGTCRKNEESGRKKDELGRNNVETGRKDEESGRKDVETGKKCGNGQKKLGNGLKN